jgi:hypothetical protein
MAAKIKSREIGARKAIPRNLPDGSRDMLGKQENPSEIVEETGNSGYNYSLLLSRAA